MSVNRMQTTFFAVLILLAISAVHTEIVTEINNDYALRMHRTLIAEDSNVLTSPLSYLTQLGILQLVSDGNTTEEIRRSIGYDQMVTTDHVHDFLSELASRMNNYIGNTFKMANVMVLRNDYPINEESAADLKRIYSASIQMYDINNSTGNMKSVNKLICGITDCFFRRFLSSPLDSYNRLAMLNAVYFSGSWQYQFHSVDGQFYNKGKTDDVSALTMMSVQGRFSFANLNMFDTIVNAVELPYEEGLKMLIILPDSTGLDGLIRIEQHLTVDGINKIDNAMREKEVRIRLPKFTLNGGKDLMWSMMRLGIHNAFNNAADFHRLSKVKGLFVTKVLHQMIFEMDTLGVKPQSEYSGNIEKEFTADHPFLFFVRDENTGMILFMGRVVSIASK